MARLILRLRRVVDVVRTATPTQLALRVALLLLGGGALALSTPGWQLPEVLILLVGALGLVGSVVAPDTGAPHFVIGAAVLGWVLRFGLDRPVPAVTTFGLAVLLYLFHTTVALTAVLPPAVWIGWGTVRRWYGREVVVVLATAATAAAAFGLHRVRGGLLLDLVGLVGVLAAVSVPVLLARRPPRQEGSGDRA